MRTTLISKSLAGLAVVGLSFFAAHPAGAVAECEASTPGAAGDTCAGAGDTGVKGQGDPGTEGAAGTEVLGVTQVRGQTLPVTGSETAGLAAAGAGMVVLGGLLVGRQRATQRVSE